MLWRVEQIRRIERNGGNLIFVQSRQLCGQPFQRYAGDDVFGGSDVGWQGRIIGAAADVTGGVDTKAGEVGPGVVDAADQLRQEGRQVPDRGALECQILEAETTSIDLRLQRTR